MLVLLARRSPVLRRLGTSVVGVVTAAVLCTACSSSGNGKAVPATSHAVSTSSTSTIGAAPSVGTSTAPSVGLSSSASGGGGGGTSSAFCKDFTQAGVTGLPSGADKSSLSKSAKFFAKAAADAPPDIKSDVQLISDFVNSYVSGHPDPTQIAKVQPALQRVVKYTTAHCSGG